NPGLRVEAQFCLRKGIKMKIAYFCDAPNCGKEAERAVLPSMTGTSLVTLCAECELEAREKYHIPTCSIFEAVHWIEHKRRFEGREEFFTAFQEAPEVCS